MNQGPPVPDDAQERHQLIAQLEAGRQSKVITYFLSDRRGASAQIADDAVRPMYDHLRAIGAQPKIDLFLYSVGGHTEVPWRIVSMVREFAHAFGVLVPYKALSAATLIALGADEVVMGRKGELGPIDPTLSRRRSEAGETVVQEEIGVEDIMSYLRFLKDKVGLSDQSALAGPVSALADKLEPWVLGQLNRQHSHIRMVARMLLTARSKGAHHDEQQIQTIIDTLAEKTYQHGHAIGRRQAKEIGLHVVEPTDEIEDLMWQLYEAYEDVCRLRDPIDPRTFIPEGADEHTEQVTVGCIESLALAHHFPGELWGRNRRQPEPQVSLNLNLNLQLPPSIQPEEIPESAQQLLQQLMGQLQAQAQEQILRQLKEQMPVVGFEGGLRGGAWHPAERWPSAS